MSHSAGGEAASPVVPYQHPPGYRRRRGRNWFFLGLTYASYYLCRYNLGIIAPELKETLHLSNTQYGAIQSARDFAYAIGQFINGLFTDRIGGKQAMTIGALATVVLNLAFGLTAWSNFVWLLPMLIVIRAADGYMQAFGAPGMIKINTAWFRREERGGFAGIFGGMIQLGAVGVGLLGKLLAGGAVIPLLFFSLTIPKLDWRFMFVIPPAIVLVIIVLMNLAVKNNPEEAGYQIRHDDEPEGPADDRVRLGEVFRKIAGNKIVWIVAGAYFCTGFVRKSIEAWWVVYLDDTLRHGKDSGAYVLLVWAIPLTAFLGSLSSGLISDKLFAGRRAPVAAALYALQALFTLAAILDARSGHASLALSLTLLILINTMCNATHSILGTAAAMDLGGRKMAGFSSGVIDSFQYYGAMLAGFTLGLLMDKVLHYGAMNQTVDPAKKFHELTWFMAMLPFGLLGTLLMSYLWWRSRGTGTRGT